MQALLNQGAAKYNRAGGSQRLKPKEGINRYRIIAPTPDQAPWVKADGRFYADVGVHWIKFDKNGKPHAIVGCKEVMKDEACELCTAIDLAINSAIDEDSKELYESFKAKKSVWVNVIDRSKGSTNDGIQVLELTAGTWGKVMAIGQQYADEGQWIFDAAEGVDIAISKSGKGLSTEYVVNVAAGASKPVDPKKMTELVDVFALAEKEFFRGDEQKALNAIKQMSGIALPKIAGSSHNGVAALAGPARTPTAALASTAAQVEDAEIEDVVEAKKPAVKAAPVAEQVEEVTDLSSVELDDDILAELDNLGN
jgi:hypothetical protein